MPGGIYFFTLNTYRRQTFLTDADVRSALREAIGTIGEMHGYVKCGLLPLDWGSTMLFFDGDTSGERMGADTLAG